MSDQAQVSPWGLMNGPPNGNPAPVNVAPTMAPQALSTPNDPAPATASNSDSTTQMLQAVGASSTSGDGTAVKSVDANSNPAAKPDPNDPDQLRTAASALLTKARADAAAASAAATPKLTPPTYTPLETAIGAILGGYMNSKSPYSSEGTQALNAYMGSKNTAAEAAYQNEVARHTQNLQGAHEAYQAAADDAGRMFAQADSTEQSNSANERQQKLLDFNAKSADEDRTQQTMMEGLREAHDMAVQKAQFDHSDLASDKNFQYQMRLGMSNVLNQTMKGRGVNAGQIADEEGYTPEQKLAYVKAAMSQTPEEAQDETREQMLREQLSQLKASGAVLPETLQAQLDVLRGQATAQNNTNKFNLQLQPLTLQGMQTNINATNAGIGQKSREMDQKDRELDQQMKQYAAGNKLATDSLAANSVPKFLEVLGADAKSYDTNVASFNNQMNAYLKADKKNNKVTDDYYLNLSKARDALLQKKADAISLQEQIMGLDPESSKFALPAWLRSAKTTWAKGAIGSGAPAPAPGTPDANGVYTSAGGARYTEGTKPPPPAPNP